VLLCALLFLYNQISYLGWVILAFGLFYLNLVFAALFGEICREGAQENV
jgi:hypothetical protein